MIVFQTSLKIKSVGSEADEWTSYSQFRFRSSAHHTVQPPAAPVAQGRHYRILYVFRCFSDIRGLESHMPRPTLWFIHSRCQATRSRSPATSVLPRQLQELCFPAVSAGSTGGRDGVLIRNFSHQSKPIAHDVADLLCGTGSEVEGLKQLRFSFSHPAAEEPLPSNAEVFSFGTGFHFLSVMNNFSAAIEVCASEGTANCRGKLLRSCIVWSDTE